MMQRTLLVLLCRTWCVRRCRLSTGFISPHLVYAVLGTSMPQLACLLSSPHLLRAHVRPQRGMWAFDTVTLRYVLRCNFVQTCCHTSVWALDTVTLRYLFSCGLVRAFCPDDFVGLVYGRNACFQNIAPRMQLCYPRPSVHEKCERTPRASDQ